MTTDSDSNEVNIWCKHLGQKWSRYPTCDMLWLDHSKSQAVITFQQASWVDLESNFRGEGRGANGDFFQCH